VIITQTCIAVYSSLKKQETEQITPPKNPPSGPLKWNLLSKITKLLCSGANTETKLQKKKSITKPNHTRKETDSMLSTLFKAGTCDGRYLSTVCNTTHSLSCRHSASLCQTTFTHMVSVQTSLSILYTQGGMWWCYTNSCVLTTQLGLIQPAYSHTHTQLCHTFSFSLNSP